jgi:hypothetical protein
MYNHVKTLIVDRGDAELNNMHFEGSKTETKLTMTKREYKPGDPGAFWYYVQYLNPGGWM